MYFAQALNELMRDSGTTAYKLAKALSVHQTTIKNWLEERTTPSADTVSAVACYFGVPVSYLLGEGPHRFTLCPAAFQIRALLGADATFDVVDMATCICLPLPDGYRLAVHVTEVSPLTAAVSVWDTSRRPVSETALTYTGSLDGMGAFLDTVCQDYQAMAARLSPMDAPSGPMEKQRLSGQALQVARDFMSLSGAHQQLLTQLLTALKDAEK